MAAMLAFAGGCDMSSTEEDLEINEVRQGLGTAGGFVVVSGDDADDGGHCQGTACGGIYPVFLTHAVADSLSPGSGILALGVNGGSALLSLNSWNSPANGGPGAVITHVTLVSDIASVNFANFKAIYLPSTNIHTFGGMTNQQIAAVGARQADFADFVNNKGGSLVALTQARAPGAWGFLPSPLTTVDIDTTNVSPTPELTAIAPLANSSNLDHCCYHNVFTGPPGFSGLKVLATRQTDPRRGEPVLLGGRNVVLTAEICNDGLDNDGDGQIDKADPDCVICGDGFLDPNEECDDGNNTDGDGCSAACRFENGAPNAVCEDKTTCNDPALCSAQVVDLGAGSTDPDGDPLVISQSPPGPYSVGQHQVLVSVSDGVAEDQCVANLDVLDCEAPSITCPSDFQVECTGNGQAPVSPPPATATDNCSVAAVNGPSAGNLPLGSSTLTYTAADDAGNQASCTTTVQVVDTTPPEVSVTPPTPLWPPNHKYHTISLADCIVAVDTCGGVLDPNSVSARIKCVSSDEPENALGDGNTGADIVFVNDTTVMLRSERQGTSDGRVYSIAFEVVDASGNIQQGVCPVSVPHDQGKGATAIDSGAAYTVCN
jgi:cysteine-rich repeat protein